MSRGGRTQRWVDTTRSAWNRLRGGQLDPRRAAASVAIGLFVGCLPLVGLQTLICVAMTVPFRLDFPLAFATTFFNNPLTITFIIALEIELGALLLQGHWVSVSMHDLTLSNLGAFAVYAMLGGVVVGTILAALGGGITLYFTTRSARLRALVQSSDRTPSTK